MYNLKEMSIEVPKGPDRGRIGFEGTPADLACASTTLTGQHLAAYVGA